MALWCKGRCYDPLGKAGYDFAPSACTPFHSTMVDQPVSQRDEAVTAARPTFTWHPYWQWQERQWSYYYDYVASLCMLLMLSTNVVGRYAQGDELRDKRIKVRCAAILAIMTVSFGLWLMRRDKNLYMRLRRLIFRITFSIVAPMVYYVNWVAGQHQNPSTFISALDIIYRNGNLMCVMLAITLRMPWQQMTLLNSLYVAWLVWAWIPVYCSRLVSMEEFAWHDNKHLQMLNTAASALDHVTGHGRFPEQDTTASWVPVAQRAVDQCGIGSLNSSISSSHNGTFGSVTSSSSPCNKLLQSQCMAVVSTFNVWFGIFFTTFCLLLAEQLSKWQWLRTHGRWMLQLPDAPEMFKTGSKGKFLQMLLMRLHVLLDVPLLLLWAFFSWMHRSGVTRS